MSMKLILENWRNFQLNEIFDNPVSSDEITGPEAMVGNFSKKVRAQRWRFKVGVHEYTVMLEDMLKGSSEAHLEDYLATYELSFHIGSSPTRGFDSYAATNYGFKSGMKVISTVVAILEEWISKNDFFLIEALADPDEENRVKMYNRTLKTLQKKLGSDYETARTDDGFLGLINVGLIERGVDKFTQKGEDRTARQLISAVLKSLKYHSIKGNTEKRVINKFNDLQVMRGIKE